MQASCLTLSIRLASISLTELHEQLATNYEATHPAISSIPSFRTFLSPNEIVTQNKIPGSK
jgi:hypothetical protein